MDDWFLVGFTNYLHSHVFHFNLVLIHSWHEDVPYLWSGGGRLDLYGLHKHELLLVADLHVLRNLK